MKSERIQNADGEAIGLLLDPDEPDEETLRLGLLMEFCERLDPEDAAARDAWILLAQRLLDLNQAEALRLWKARMK